MPVDYRIKQILKLDSKRTRRLLEVPAGFLTRLACLFNKLTQSVTNVTKELVHARSHRNFSGILMPGNTVTDLVSHAKSEIRLS